MPVLRTVTIAVGANRQFRLKTSEFDELDTLNLSGTPSVTIGEYDEDGNFTASDIATIGTASVDSDDILVYIQGDKPGKTNLYANCAANVSPARPGGKLVLVVE